MYTTVSYDLVQNGAVFTAARETEAADEIILPDLRAERKESEYQRQWINNRFQLLNADGNALAAMFIPFDNVTIPVSKEIFDDTGIECAQVRGTTSEAEYEAAFLKSQVWDKQFPGVVTVCVTAEVLALHKQFFAGKSRDNEKASAKFRSALGALVMADPTKFMYKVTDGAHRTKLGKGNFPPKVTSCKPRTRCIHAPRLVWRFLHDRLPGNADGTAQQHCAWLEQDFSVRTPCNHPLNRIITTQAQQHYVVPGQDGQCLVPIGSPRNVIAYDRQAHQGGTHGGIHRKTRWVQPRRKTNLGQFWPHFPTQPGHETRNCSRLLTDSLQIASKLTRNEWLVLKDDYDSGWRTKLIKACMEDPEGDMSDLSTKPIAVEDIIGIVEYKFLPDRLRQMVLAELVYCTNPLTRVYPGCVNTVDRSLGRREAFWLALCRSVIINEAHLVQSAVISKIPPRSGLEVKVSLFRKQQLSDYEFDRDSLETFAGDLGDFDGQAHKDLCFALKIGGKAPFVAPIDMTLESNSTTAKAAKALLMMTLPFRLVPDQLGIKQADDGDGDSDNEGDDTDDEESSGQRCNVMHVMDSAAAATYVELKKDMKIIRASYEANGGDLRCIVVTSPPWGVLDDERTEPGHEDEPLTSDAIAALAIGLSELFGSKTVVCIHLPPLEQHAWRKKFEATGKWAAYNNPVVVVPTSTKSLTYFNKYQQANNVFSFLCFHRADVHPIVTSDFLREKPGMHKLCHALWNAGTTIPSAVVPKAERVAVRMQKKTTYMRTQQLATAVVRPLIRMFGRAMKEQEPVVIVDPFMGTGSTAVAARQLGCGFIGWDRDQTIVHLAQEKFRALNKVHSGVFTTVFVMYNVQQIISYIL